MKLQVSLMKKTSEENKFKNYMVTVNVHPQDSIYTLKFKIKARFSFPTSHQVLVHKSKKLEEGKRIKEYELKDGDTIYLIEHLETKKLNLQVNIVLFINQLENGLFSKLFQLKVNKGDSVFLTKEKLKHNLSIGKQFYLVSNYKILEETKSLEENGLINDSKLFIIQKELQSKRKSQPTEETEEKRMKLTKYIDISSVMNDLNGKKLEKRLYRWWIPIEVTFDKSTLPELALFVQRKSDEKEYLVSKSPILRNGKNSGAVLELDLSTNLFWMKENEVYQFSFVVRKMKYEKIIRWVKIEQ